MCVNHSYSSIEFTWLVISLYFWTALVKVVSSYPFQKYYQRKKNQDKLRFPANDHVPATPPLRSFYFTAVNWCINTAIIQQFYSSNIFNFLRASSLVDAVLLTFRDYFLQLKPVWRLFLCMNLFCSRTFISSRH